MFWSWSSSTPTFIQSTCPKGSQGVVQRRDEKVVGEEYIIKGTSRLSPLSEWRFCKELSSFDKIKWN